MSIDMCSVYISWDYEEEVGKILDEIVKARGITGRRNKCVKDTFGVMKPILVIVKKRMASTTEMMVLTVQVVL